MFSPNLSHSFPIIKSTKGLLWWISVALGTKTLPLPRAVKLDLAGVCLRFRNNKNIMATYLK